MTRRQSPFFPFLALLLLTSACTLIPQFEDSANYSSAVKNYLALRSTAYKAPYIGGSLLYDETDLTTSSLFETLTIYIRSSTIDKTEIEGNKFIYKDNSSSAIYGYIVINKINKDAIIFNYFQFSSNPLIETAKNIGTFTLTLGNSLDITGDSIADISYSLPPIKRLGDVGLRYLSFLTNAKMLTSNMFNVNTIQYKNNTYPGGLIAINSLNRYIISRYEKGSTRPSSVIRTITYGDYVIDYNKNTLYLFNSLQPLKDPRALKEADLQELTTQTLDDTAESYLYKESEFIGKFNALSLLSALPSSVLTTNISNLSNGEAVTYLNTLLQSNSFLPTLLQSSTNPLAKKIKKSLANTPYNEKNALIKLLTGRLVLSLLYPSLAPKYLTTSTLISLIFPLYYEDLGGQDAFLPENLSYNSSISIEENAHKEKLKEQGYSAKYIEYTLQKTRYYYEFNKYKTYTLLNTLDPTMINPALLGLKDSIDMEVKLGIGGVISVIFGCPSLSLTTSFLQRTEASFPITPDNKEVMVKSANYSLLTDKENKKAPASFNAVFNISSIIPLAINCNILYNALIDSTNFYNNDKDFLGQIVVDTSKLSASLSFGFKKYYTIENTIIAPDTSTFYYKASENVTNRKLQVSTFCKKQQGPLTITPTKDEINVAPAFTSNLNLGLGFSTSGNYDLGFSLSSAISSPLPYDFTSSFPLDYKTKISRSSYIYSWGFKKRIVKNLYNSASARMPIFP